MKVLHVVATGQRRGGEIFASDLTRYLKRCGVDQRVLVLRATHCDVDFDVPVRAVTRDGSRGPVSIPALGTVRKVLARWRPDVIQAHGGEALKHVVPPAATTGSCLVYRRIGGSSPALSSSRVRRRVYAELMARARRVVTVAEALRGDTIAQFGLSEQRVVTIPNGIDPARLSVTIPRDDVRAALGIHPGDRALLSVGAIVPEKDPDALADAAALIMERDARAVFVLAGDGSMRGNLERRLAERGLSARCRILGRRPDIGDLMRASDVLLFVGRDDGMEGMPAVLIEAAMMSLPTVAFDVAGVSEVVAHDRTGVLVPWRDLAGLADAAVRLLSDEARSARLARAARREAMRFEIGTVGDRYLDLYESLIA